MTPVCCWRYCAPLTPEDHYYYVSHCEACEMSAQLQARETHADRAEALRMVLDEVSATLPGARLV